MEAHETAWVQGARGLGWMNTPFRFRLAEKGGRFLFPLA